MIKLTFCLRRLSHLTRPQFQDYWYNNHAPLVAKHRESLKIRRCVQTHALTHEANDALAAPRNAPEIFDGVAELWWDRIEDVTDNSSAQSQAAALALLEDERKFIDLPRSPLWFGEERAIFG